jgi:ATP-dependent Lhr-like helicase
MTHPLSTFQPAVRDWFRASFEAPTPAQVQGWPPIAKGESTLLLAPTGSGKTLAAFLACIDRVMFSPVPSKGQRCRIIYVSPLKALAVDVERNLRAPIIGIANVAAARGDAFLLPTVAVRTGDTAATDRARFQREPADILITTPESLYLLLTSNAREALRSVETVIVDEIHALVPTKRGAHLALSLERLEHLAGRSLQRIGLSATQRPLEEVARFLGGVVADPTPGSREAPPAMDGGSTGATESVGLSAALPPRSPAPRAVTTTSSPPPSQPGEASIETGDSRDAAGEFAVTSGGIRWRPVTVVDAGNRKTLSLRIEVPVEDMAKIGEPIEIPSGPAAQGTVRTSIWTAIHPRLLELIRQHRSTLLFVNSRRIAERLAAALNELAGEPLARAHHGSLARGQRAEIEDALKAGHIRALVATSSLELGIDMGAIDLVVQIEAPPSVASGMQRIGRAGHQIGAPSTGVIFPKYRGDLLACAALAEAMADGRVEAIRAPRNPLDVLAQQLVAMAGVEPWDVDTLYATVRQAGPYAELSRTVFDHLLDLLAGRYASDDFAELRPRLTWDRVANTVVAREGAKRIAIVNGGTIPDRGLYGVFLASSEKAHARVGELDEEMVFESKVGEVFLLGASSWRIEEITHDRVLVSPAPGQPGKMPFWHGDAPARSLETGQMIGRLIRELRALPPAAARDRLVDEHQLDPAAAQNLLRYLDDQTRATVEVADDQTLVVERTRDELGDWRVCILSPLGGRVHAPWSMALTARIRDVLGLDVETMWTNDGIVVRFPDMEAPPDVQLLLPGPDEVEGLVLRQLGGTALFAAKFRENASRALLLPRRRPGVRTPLWQQRKRAADLLAVASRHADFPLLLETYRECLRDVFEMPALVGTLRAIATRAIRVHTVDTQTPSPFASSLLFGFVANYLYDGDAPLAERRAQALSIDQAQLRELLGETELRELLDADVLAAVEAELQQRDPRFRARGTDGLHDLLLRVGDLSGEELRERSTSALVAEGIRELVEARRAVPLRLGPGLGVRFVAAEDAVRYRDGLGTPLSPGLPESLLVPVKDPLGDLISRFARTHGPFTSMEAADRFGLAPGHVEPVLEALARRGRLLEGAFRPWGAEREWCDPEVLATIRRRSLARARHAVEPVEPRVLGRFLAHWHGLIRPRPGLDAVLDAVERLQGHALPVSVLESEVLPARVERYSPGDLDTLVSVGEVSWAGVEPLGERDGRVALYLTDHLPRLLRPLPPGARLDTEPLSERAQAVLEVLRTRGASFFGPLQQAIGGGFPRETIDALWELVWKGLVTNDTFGVVRAYSAPRSDRPRARGLREGRSFRSRRTVVPTAAGRWSLLPDRSATGVSATEWSAATAQQLLARHGLVTREVAGAEGLPGGFSAVYDVFKSLEESGRVRRGYFVSGVGAVQFALPPVLDLLRSLREIPETPEVTVLAATDPANPYGTFLRWPTQDGSAARGPSRSAGAQVVLVDGTLGAFVSRGGRQAWVWLPEAEPERTRLARATARALAQIAARGLVERRGGMLLEEINGASVGEHPLALHLVEVGFAPSPLGFSLRRSALPVTTPHA